MWWYSGNVLDLHLQWCKINSLMQHYRMKTLGNFLTLHYHGHQEVWFGKLRGKQAHRTMHGPTLPCSGSGTSVNAHQRPSKAVFANATDFNCSTVEQRATGRREISVEPKSTEAREKTSMKSRFHEQSPCVSKWLSQWLIPTLADIWPNAFVGSRSWKWTGCIHRSPSAGAWIRAY